MGPESTSISTYLSYNIKTKKERKRKRITFEFELMDERNAKWIDTKYHNLGVINAVSLKYDVFPQRNFQVFSKASNA